MRRISVKRSVHFYFFQVVVGSEKLAKQALSEKIPELKFAYSRPGLLTGKLPGVIDLDLVPSWIAMVGETLWSGKAIQLEEAVSCHAKNAKPLEIYFCKRTPELVTEQSILTQFSTTHSEQSYILVQSENDLFFLVKPLVHGFQTFYAIGWESDSNRSELPIGVPSRAYYKIFEMQKVFRLPVLPGHKVIELGSAPGGATAFGLQQGCFVWGVDRAQMDAGILSNSKFTWVKNSVFHTLKADYPEIYDWLWVDMNTSMEVTYQAVELIVRKVGLPGLGMVITLKCAKDSYWPNAEIVAHKLESLLNKRKLGSQKLQHKKLMCQLFQSRAHRKEIACLAYFES